jgi:Na+/phosphate symporter
VRQTANLHTGVMLTSALLVLPFCPGFAGLLKRLIRSRPHPETEQSHLTTDAMAHPDTALLAVRRELERLTRLGLRSLELTSALLRRPSLEDHREVKTIETIFDAVKSTMLRELRRLLRHPDLSRAEILEVDRWMHRAVQMERIGDHLDTLRKISEERRQEPGHLLFGRDLTARLDDMFARTRDELDALARWLHEGSHSPYTEITERHLAFLAAANEARERLTSKMQDARLQPRAMYYYSSYLEVFERLFRHIQLVALPGSITLLDEESEQEKTDAGTQNPFSA